MNHIKKINEMFSQHPTASEVYDIISNSLKASFRIRITRDDNNGRNAGYIKFAKLRDKMLENINETKDEVTELNMKYMDISTKLTLLQNHQLLVQLDYQAQQLEESTRKNEIYKKKIEDLTKDIELHKEVEVSFAEKNRKLVRELMRYKNEENKDNNNNNKDNNKEIKISEGNSAFQGNNSIMNSQQQQSLNLSLATNNSFNKLGFGNNNDFNWCFITFKT